ncbi:MAG TPA: hypothetical protein VGM42_10775 [Rhodopila sp.]|jgi:hypothetical protein
MMKTLFLAAFAALSLITVIAPVADAASFGRPATAYHQGPYDNTANSLGGRYVGEGD